MYYCKLQNCKIARLWDCETVILWLSSDLYFFGIFISYFRPPAEPEDSSWFVQTISKLYNNRKHYSQFVWTKSIWKRFPNRSSMCLLPAWHSVKIWTPPTHIHSISFFIVISMNVVCVYNIALFFMILNKDNTFELIFWLQFLVSEETGHNHRCINMNKFVIKLSLINTQIFYIL